MFFLLLNLLDKQNLSVWETETHVYKSSHIYLYSAFHNTDYIKAASHW